MSLLRPEALFWAVLAVPLVVLYLRGDRIRQQAVSAGSLWQKVLADRPSRTRWLRWRRPASLAVQLVVLFTMVLAMAEPQWWPCLAIAVLVILVAEWRLFQRRWTC
jgi:hypothetical protein